MGYETLRHPTGKSRYVFVINMCYNTDRICHIENGSHWTFHNLKSGFRVFFFPITILEDQMSAASIQRHSETMVPRTAKCACSRKPSYSCVLLFFCFPFCFPFFPPPLLPFSPLIFSCFMCCLYMPWRNICRWCICTHPICHIADQRRLSVFFLLCFFIFSPFLFVFSVVRIVLQGDPAAGVIAHIRFVYDIADQRRLFFFIFFSVFFFSVFF